jgi:hypothetical protein
VRKTYSRFVVALPPFKFSFKQKKFFFIFGNMILERKLCSQRMEKKTDI